MHKLAEIVFDQELEVIPTIINETPLKNVNEGIWYLGESIKMLAHADYFICFDTTFTNSRFKGCEIEKEVAMTYEIPMYQISDPVMEMYLLEDVHKRTENIIKFLTEDNTNVMSREEE